MDGTLNLDYYSSVTSVVEFVDVSQQGLHFSKKSVKEKCFFDLTFTDVHMGCQKSAQFLTVRVSICESQIKKLFFFYGFFC
jgi:hypothetical protein